MDRATSHSIARVQNTGDCSMPKTGLGSNASIDLNKRIIFALDLDAADTARAWVKRLESRIGFYKVGLELFLAGGFPLVDWILQRGHEVMLDLKFFDVPQTVAAAVRQCLRFEVSFITVHGNDAMLEAAVGAGGRDRILAVTALTSLDQGDLASLGFACSLEALVTSRAERALAMGCRGVVASGREAPLLRERLGSSLCIVTPGVRPISNTEHDDQKRIVDPATAIRQGADHIVVGRPLRRAVDPLAAAAQMQKAIQEVLEEDSIQSS